MRTSISVKWGDPSRGVNNVIISKLRKVENIHPIVLLITQKTPEVLFQRLIGSFRLPIGLGMVAGGEVTRDLEHLEEMLPNFGETNCGPQSLMILFGRS